MQGYFFTILSDLLVTLFVPFTLCEYCGVAVTSIEGGCPTEGRNIMTCQMFGSTAYESDSRA